MDNERIIYLLKVYQEQTATPAEKAEFTDLLHDKRYEEVFNQLLDQHWAELTSEEIDQLEIPGYDRILKEIKEQPQTMVRKINIWPRVAIAAASILLVFSLGLYFFTSSPDTPSSQITTQNNIAPGKNGATLTLANGKKIFINDALAGNIAEQSGVKISKTADGQIIYEVIDLGAQASSAFNTLSTTRGEQTQVRLQDGTVVFLNAESSLTYPTSFAKNEKREVTMAGEAYFEVAKDKKHPFIVTAKGQKVEVLGTHFNVNSYPDEPAVKTTLLEGSVKVTPLEATPSFVILKPGEQSTIKNLIIDTKTVETDDVIAWKNGAFMFNNETLESIMKKVARWYDVQVVYKDENIKQKTFFGTLSRFANVSEVLNMLQGTEAVVFDIKGKQIIVDQKK
jgi:transmembrane sensor